LIFIPDFDSDFYSVVVRLADGVLFYFLSKCWPDTHTNFILVSFFFCRLNDIKPIVSVCLFFFLLFADKNRFLFVFYFVCFFPPPNSLRSFRLDLGANFLIRLKKRTKQNNNKIASRKESNPKIQKVWRRLERQWEGEGSVSG
jgi:hypothetical protein